MKSSSDSDISDLEEDKQIKNVSRNRSHLLEESEFAGPSTVSIVITDLSLGEPQKVREGRDGYYVYPVIVQGKVLSLHRYKEFVWLKNELSILYPASATPALPDKEGVIGYWSNQDPIFYTFRRYGLEKFLQRINKHPKLSKSPDFISFVKDDELSFQVRMKKSESNKGWYGVISDWGSSIAGAVTSYITHDQLHPQEDGDSEFSNHKNEIKLLYQQQETLCGQGRSLVTSEENEINSNLALSKAYENMSKVEKETLADKLKILAETHLSITEAHKSSFDKLRLLVGQEMEDYKRITLGLLEALERREKIKSDKNLSAQYNIKEINNEIRKEISKFNQEKAFLSQVVSQQLIMYKQELSEKISEVWREAYIKIDV
jgi:PX domain